MTADRVRIGVLTPSSNTVLEPVTAEILSGLEGVTAHFSRFPVTRIALGDEASAQFELQPMLAAARLLADARVDVIAWSGTSASWLGFARDAALCQAISAETGIAACTSVLALNTLIDRCPTKTIGLVTPYTKDVQEQIKANYDRSGYAVIADARLDIADNFAFATVPAERVADLCRDVGRAKPDCIVIMCTNMQGAHIAPLVEHELGIPVYDSAAAVIWQALCEVGISTRQVAGWGRMFAF